MKSILSIFAAALIITACGNADSKSKSFNPSSDTTKIFGVWKLDKLMADSAFKVVKDSLMPTKDDPTKNEWQKYTFYIIPVSVDTATKKVSWLAVADGFVDEINVKSLLNK